MPYRQQEIERVEDVLDFAEQITRTMIVTAIAGNPEGDPTVDLARLVDIMQRRGDVTFLAGVLGFAEGAFPDFIRRFRSAPGNIRAAFPEAFPESLTTISK